MSSIFDDDDITDDAISGSAPRRDAAPRRLPGRRAHNEAQAQQRASQPARPVPQRPQPQNSQPQRPAPERPPLLPAARPIETALPSTAAPQRQQQRRALAPPPSQEVSTPRAAPARVPQEAPLAQAPRYAPEPEEPIYAPPARVDSLYEEAEDDEPQRKKKTKKKKKNAKGSRVKKRSPEFAGGRGQVVLVRWLVVGGILALAGFGVKSIVVPPSFPSQEQVVEAVQTGLEVTDFPADRGSGFALAFADSYLTYSPENQDTRASDLANYVPDTILLNATGSFGDTEQSIVEGPYIANTRFEDDNNAVYTVSARLNSGIWIYVDVPLYWNPELNTLAVSGIPAFTGQPPLSDVPAQPIEWEEDEDAAADFEQWVPTFFTAWAASDEQGLLPLLSPEANVRAEYGLNGTVTFNGMTDLKVSGPLDPEDTSDTPLREARVDISWNIAGTGGGDTTPTTYQASYQLLVTYNATEEKWSIIDIRGGVPEDESDSTSVEDQEESVEDQEEEPTE